MEKNLVIEKKQLRDQIRALTQSCDWETISTGVLKNIKEHSVKFPKKAAIGGYWPIKNEINSLSFLEEWSNDGGIICLPVIEKNNTPLLFYPWIPQSEMEIGSYQIPIPKIRKESILPDILLIPFLAFDNQGYRLGRGAGFYDHTIHKLRQEKDIYVIGLGAERQLVSLVPHESHDERMDCVMTDKSIYILR